MVHIRTLTITLTRLAGPSQVWVWEDWEPTTPTSSEGEVVVDPDGASHVYGYDAFYDIAYGIEAVSGSTVHVFAGEYASFNITSDDVTVVAEEPGAVINTFVDPWGYTQNAMALVGQDRYGDAPAENATIDGLMFDCDIDNPNLDDGDAAIRYYQSTGTVNDVTIDGFRFDGETSNQGFGIVVGYSESNTVTITDCDISGCNIGVYVKDDTIVVDNCEIYGAGTYGSYCSTGVWVDWDGDATISSTDIYECTPYDYHPPVVILLEAPADGNGASGVYVEENGTALINNCCNLYSNYVGVYAECGADVTANGNNIYDNWWWGAYWDCYGAQAPGDDEATLVTLDFQENWWGTEEGPNTLYLLTGDVPEAPAPVAVNMVSFGIDFTPWLDGPCPNGNPVGMSARFKGVARTGEPGLKVIFTDLSTPAPGCEIIEWLWDFGDGSTSTEQNPTHVYAREGNYTVTLTVWDSCDFSNTVTMKAYIVIAAPKDTSKPEPANLGVSYLNIDPAQVLPNQEVTVSANICNSGEERGTRTVSLMVNGVAEQSQSVGVGPGACQQVIFKVSRVVPGTYQVAIEGMSGQFSVLATRTVTNNVPSQQQTGLGTAGIIAIIAVLVVLIIGLIVVFRQN